jgi:hypothetical protein
MDLIGRACHMLVHILNPRKAGEVSVWLFSASSLAIRLQVPRRLMKSAIPLNTGRLGRRKE